MNLRKNMLATALLVAMGGSGMAWAGSTCVLNDTSSVGRTTDGGSTAKPVAGASTACGYQNVASNYIAMAFGTGNTASGNISGAFGWHNTASGKYSSAFGATLVFSPHAPGVPGLSVASNEAVGDYSNAFGLGNSAAGKYSSAFGTLSVTGSGANYSVAFGAGNPEVSLMDGANVVANATSAIAIGHTVTVGADDGVAIGHGATVQSGATGAVAIGSGSVADTANTISVGASGAGRRIVHVAAGTTDTDAVNVGQMQAYAASLAGSASPWFTGTGSVAVTDGHDYPTVTGSYALAAGGYSEAGLFGSAYGYSSQAAGKYSSAFGFAAQAGGVGSSALGFHAVIGSGADYSIAIGSGDDHSPMGALVSTDATNAIAIGHTVYVLADEGIAMGFGAYVGQNAPGSVVMGHMAGTHAADGVAIGRNSTVKPGAADALALGSDTTATEADTVSVGHAATDMNPSTGMAYGSALQRRIVNVAPGQVPTDAVNKAQLDVVAAQAGQVAANAVTYDGADRTGLTLAGLGGTSIGNVRAGTLSASSTEAVNGSQLYAVTQSVAANSASINTIGNMAVFYADAAHTLVTFGTVGTPVALSNVADGTAPTDAVNKAQLDAVVAQVGQVAGNAVAYDAADKADVTLAGATGTAIHNVAAGTADGDAVNKGQLDAVDAQVDSNTASITTNTMDVAGNTIAIHDLDSRVTTVENQVGQLQQATTTLSYLAVDGKGDGSDAAQVMKGGHGVAIGSNASAGGSHGTAVGGDSYAAGTNDTALGGHARVSADGSTAVGANTAIAKAATNAVAVGESATVKAASGTAIGQGAQVTASHAVALGQGSVADQADTVSVGSAGHGRRVTHVAMGTAATDAVNKGQLDTVTAQAVETAKTYAQTGDEQTLRQANAYTDQQIQAALGGDIAAFRRNVNDRFYQINRRMDRLSAMQSASAQMAINAADAQGNGRLAVGVGFSSGKSALSVGYGAPLGHRLHISFGATASGSEASAGIGFGVDL